MPHRLKLMKAKQTLNFALLNETLKGIRLFGSLIGVILTNVGI